MKITIVTTHSFPIPYKIHTGDIVITDLAKTLDEMGHEVTLIAPPGSYCPPHGKQLDITCSFGAATPTAEDREREAFSKYVNILTKQDVVHDFSTNKCIADILFRGGFKKVISTLMGGAWTSANPPRNLVVWSQAHRDRVIRGATDYENTPTPDMAGHTGIPINDAHVVHGGIDTNFYTPTYEKKDYYLWLGRWHPVRGYRMAIELAKKSGIELIMAGEHPDKEVFINQKECALEAIELAKGSENIKFAWLPDDPDHHIAKRHLYREAKALLYTAQFNEPFGLSQAEALACGTPIIATNYGSMPEVITDGLTGYICNNKINNFISATKIIDRINPKKCREDAINRFDYQSMAKAYIEQYKKVINGENW